MVPNGGQTVAQKRGPLFRFDLPPEASAGSLEKIGTDSACSLSDLPGVL